MELSRRNFLQIGALAGATALGTGLLTGCSSEGSTSSSNSSDSSQSTKKVDFNSLPTGTLKVGAGSALIKLDDYLPIDEGNTQANAAGYTHAEGYYSNVKEGQDLRFNIVLIDFNDEKFALNSIEHVNPSDINKTKELVQELTGVAPEYQWYHNPHVLSAPHDIPWDAVEPAVREACDTALKTTQDATYGFGEGVTYANINRCYEVAAGWEQVSNDSGNTDHVLPVMRFNGADDQPIAILYTVNMASGTLENQMNSDLDPTARQVTGDIAGLSERAIEEYYGGDCVAIYFAGCTGDQWGATRAEYNYVSGSADNLQYNKGFVDNATGWVLLEQASSRLGVSVIDTANKIECGPVHVIEMVNEKFDYDQLDKDKLKSGSDPNQFVYEQSTENPTLTTDITMFAIDDTAIIGVKPEMNIQSLKDIREASPYANNILQNWVSFDDDSVQGYLPDQEGFDQSGKQASKTSFMPGSAEQMVENAIGMLNENYG